MTHDEGQSAFTCRMCGHCCEGGGGIVMARRDRDRLAAHLGLDEATMLERYAEQRNGKWYLRVGGDGFCLFFKEGCSVHVAKPDVCRAWPFFRGNLVDEDSWAMAQEYCPGINPEAGHAAFVREGVAYIKENGLEGDDAPDSARALRLP
ncbi:MAG: YkgJ family cysteine cluster protein [Desulfovibrionaceae bacterium]